jgi:hypothetical protein
MPEWSLLRQRKVFFARNNRENEECPGLPDVQLHAENEKPLGALRVVFTLMENIWDETIQRRRTLCNRK